MDTENLYKQNIALLQNAGIEYREIEHEPVLSYEKAAQRSAHDLKNGYAL